MLASLLLSLTVAQPFQLGTNLPINAPHNAITHVECIFKQINVPFHLQKLPWLRAKREVQLNRPMVILLLTCCRKCKSMVSFLPRCF